VLIKILLDDQPLLGRERAPDQRIDVRQKALVRRVVAQRVAEAICDESRL
jgi:hypothetical protein